MRAQNESFIFGLCIIITLDNMAQSSGVLWPSSPRQSTLHNCDSIDVMIDVNFYIIDFQSCYHNVCLFRTRMIEVCSLSGLAIA